MPTLFLSIKVTKIIKRLLVVRLNVISLTYFAAIFIRHVVSL
jgi:hypothetical protein